MSMAELALMAEIQKWGDSLPTTAMMNEFARAQGVNPTPAQPANSLGLPFKERSVIDKKVRAVKFAA
jgi:hypothetical protein